LTENNTKVVFTPEEAPSAVSLGAMSIAAMTTVGIGLVAVDFARLHAAATLAVQAIRALIQHFI
jgi:hypothetical protein